MKLVLVLEPVFVTFVFIFALIHCCMDLLHFLAFKVLNFLWNDL